MKNFTHYVWALLAVITLSCNDDDDRANDNPAGQNPVTDAEFAQNFGAEVQRDFIGQVVDTDNHPVVGAQVSIGSSTAQTDSNGVFIIDAAGVHEKFAYITATKPGFINGSRAMVPTTGRNNVKIMLVPAEITQTIPSGAVATVDLPNGSKVAFDGAFEDAGGSAYSGSVNVSVYHLESSDQNLESLMPGMLYAKNNSGQPVGLETFGMMHVELRGSGGQKLQIASGHMAEITMPVDASQLATAPATIPLWHFDEANGYWKEEGFATRQGNKYVGKVSHFSWWNCDLFLSVVRLTVKLMDSAGTPLPHLGVGLTVSSTGFVSSVNPTNDFGTVSGLVPGNETIILKIYNMCGEVIHTAQIGPYTTDAEHIVTLDANIVSPSIIRGKLTTCNGANVTNGYVLIAYSGISQILPMTNGFFEIVAIACNGSLNLTLQAFDLENLQTTGILSYTAAAGTNDLGSIPVCTAIEEYISMRVGNQTNYIFDHIELNYNSEFTAPFAVRTNHLLFDRVGFNLENSSTAPGVYYYPGLVNHFSYRYFSSNGQMLGYSLTSPGANCKLVIYKYGEIGDYIDFSFEGSHPSLEPVFINGHIKRNN